jgi:apolipoprotein D and lipocalin family protein
MALKKKYLLIGGAAVLAAASVVLLSSCGSKIPEGATAVKPFDVDRYVGKWYEVARLDFKYEKGLNNVTADYTLSNDGSINVINRGYDLKKDKWEEAKGKAKFVDAKDEARLKVSFFGPFYSGYNVIAIDADYQYALVAGESLKYLWLLSRETTMPENIKRDYLQKAKAIGYNTDDLVWVKHDRN